WGWGLFAVEISAQMLQVDVILVAGVESQPRNRLAQTADVVLRQVHTLADLLDGQHLGQVKFLNVWYFGHSVNHGENPPLLFGPSPSRCAARSPQGSGIVFLRRTVW